MNRKQKKAKRLNATAHKKKQAHVQLTPKQNEDIYKWERENHYKIWDDELLETDSESNDFIKIVKIALWIVLIVTVGLFIRHFG
ncbi:hypothetical protein F900_01890 [Acinetobacter modestus]|uniref:Uncharacterized protein n=1 Tax=Acinetobacter modestus TaxID=1776740 RepID=N9N5J2_9GAMM|nr:hypothetical protein [Acinetobacter modestus]ENX00906.1 hypothetical protein F900_01890 [Acinetobacter modestus]